LINECYASIITTDGFITLLISKSWPGQHLPTGWMVQGSNPGGSEIFRLHPYWPWGPPSLLYTGYCVSFPGVKQTGRGIEHLPASGAEVTERVQQYLYSPSGHTWSVLG